MKKIGGVLFGLFLVGNMPQGAAAREWGGMQGSRSSASILVEAPAAVHVEPVIDDPLGDHITSLGNAIVDIDMVEGGNDGANVTLKITFSQDTVMSQVVGFIDLDTDRNPATGIPPNANFYIPGTMQDIGVDFFLSLFSLPFGGLVDVLNATTGAFMGSVPATIVGQSLEITVPLTMLGGSNGGMHVGMVLGNFSQATDASPDVGHGTILPPGKAIISPGSSTLVTRQAFDVVFIIETFGHPITGGSISLNGVDITATVLAFTPVIGSTPGGQLTARLPRFGPSLVRPGSNALSIVLTTRTGTFGDTVMYEVITSAEP